MYLKAKLSHPRYNESRIIDQNTIMWSLHHYYINNIITSAPLMVSYEVLEGVSVISIYYIICQVIFLYSLRFCPCFSTLYCFAPFSTILYCFDLYFTILYYLALFCTILYCFDLFFTLLYYLALFFTILCCFDLFFTIL